MTGSLLRISRRAALARALATGLCSALPALYREADAASLPVIRKRIPSTGELLPVIGIGTNSFRDAEYEELRQILARMHALGGRLIDTAARYGESEGVIGRALASLDLRKKMFVATKFNAPGVNLPFRRMGPPGGAPGRMAGGPGGRGFRGPPPDNVYGQASFDRSLERLKTDHVDLLYAHFIPSVEPLMPLMRDLKSAGKTRYIGITTFLPQQHDMLTALMRKYPIDFVQVDYSIADRDAEKMVFPVAIERRLAVVVDVPFGGRFGSVLAKTKDKPLPAWAADIGATSWSQFLLKYVISHPAVTCAIPGSTQLAHLIDNQLAGHGVLPDAAMRKRMESYWDSIA
ncbi:MAG TPA: aldo/keto reductase [Steroidobacteraceae bacterium]|nr:aldo/keto reductase [Steroidobacteraceae bacterium]